MQSTQDDEVMIVAIMIIKDYHNPGSYFIHIQCVKLFLLLKSLSVESVEYIVPLGSNSRLIYWRNILSHLNTLKMQSLIYLW